MTATRLPADPAAGVAGLRTLGTGAQQAAAGNDPRFGGNTGNLGGGNAMSAYDGTTPTDGGLATSTYSSTPIDGGVA